MEGWLLEDMASPVNRGGGELLGVGSYVTGSLPGCPSKALKGRPTAASSFALAHPCLSPLTEKVNIRVLDPFTIKPLDKKLILDSARATKGRILTVEDHYYEGESARDTQLDIQPQEGSCSPGNPE